MSPDRINTRADEQRRAEAAAQHRQQHAKPNVRDVRSQLTAEAEALQNSGKWVLQYCQQFHAWASKRQIQKDVAEVRGAFTRKSVAVGWQLVEHTFNPDPDIARFGPQAGSQDSTRSALVVYADGRVGVGSNVIGKWPKGADLASGYSYFDRVNFVDLSTDTTKEDSYRMVGGYKKSEVEDAIVKFVKRTGVSFSLEPLIDR